MHRSSFSPSETEWEKALNKNEYDQVLVNNAYVWTITCHTQYRSARSLQFSSPFNQSCRIESLFLQRLFLCSWCLASPVGRHLPKATVWGSISQLEKRKKYVSHFPIMYVFAQVFSTSPGLLIPRVLKNLRHGHSKKKLYARKWKGWKTHKR